MVETPSDDDPPPFMVLTLHSVPISPVGYIPPASSRLLSQAPVRLPREDAEDTLSFIITCEKDAKDGAGSVMRWCSVECIGSWDTRWG
jgi:hypothetical protein